MTEPSKVIHVRNVGQEIYEGCSKMTEPSKVIHVRNVGQEIYEVVAQFGVVFLLFALGLEFSLTKFISALSGSRSRSVERIKGSMHAQSDLYMGTILATWYK